MIYFISLSEGAQWIRVKCPTMRYETLIKKLGESGLKEFTVLFRNGKIWDCNMTRILSYKHNWRHLVMENIKFWKELYNQLMKEKLLATEQQHDLIKFQDLTFII